MSVIKSRIAEVLESLAPGTLATLCVGDAAAARRMVTRDLLGCLLPADIDDLRSRCPGVAVAASWNNYVDAIERAVKWGRVQP